MRLVLALSAAALAASTAHATADDQIVLCSPGSAGTSAEAQPALDKFAAAVTAKAGAKVAAVYDETEDGGVKRLGQAGIAIVSLPFFLKHEQELKLHARLEVVQKGRPALDMWTLVAKKGAKLDGATVYSNAAFAPGFVRGALGAALPAGAKLQQSTAVLSSLKKADRGEAVAVVLDGTQAASLASLPFAADLATVGTSPALPAAIVATIDARMPDAKWAPIGKAMTALASDPTGKAALDAIQQDRFAPLDESALAAARKAYASAPK